jgi:hypothetical protein
MTSIEKMARAIAAEPLLIPGLPGEAGLTMNLSVDAARRIAIACLQALKDPDEGTGEAFGIALWENADYDGPRASDERAAINAFLDHIIKGGSE